MFIYEYYNKSHILHKSSEQPQETNWCVSSLTIIYHNGNHQV